MIAASVMDEWKDDILRTLLPKPRDVRLGPGLCRIGSNVRLKVEVDDARVRRAGERLIAVLPPLDTEHGVWGALRLVVDSGVIEHPDGYRLTVRRNRIEVQGGSAAGCFYGLGTLEQLARGCGGVVPYCEIVDWPDFATRGLLHDVTRGKVPTLETLKLLVERLSLLKVNQLQLYIEHSFVFSFDPDICDWENGLTPDEVRALDAYCRERFIDLVPAVANLGHMGRMLSMPRYRHLAEVESTKPWKQMTWPERARGLTLDVLNSDSHRLVERIWLDILDAFSGPVVNICGDEPWDLGKGKNRERLPGRAIGKAYLDHIRRVHDLCASRSRRCQVFSDVIGNHKELLARLPGDLTLLHWGYDESADYDGTAGFVGAGVGTFVCPGTSGWKRIINAMDVAERNIAVFAKAGRRRGATGLLNTDWGDHGHFNQLACSWHGIALGAACAWNVAHPTGEDFDRRFARCVWGCDDTAGVKLLREVSADAGACETWRLMWQPVQQICDDPTLPSIDRVERSRNAVRRAGDWFTASETRSPKAAQDFRELAVACRFMDIFADRVQLARGTVGVDGGTVRERVRKALNAYGNLWHARNKPSGLADIRAALVGQ